MRALRGFGLFSNLSGMFQIGPGANAAMLNCKVLLNLVSNVMDAMADTPGPGRCVTLRTERHGESVQVSVLDRGHGIKSEDMALLFEFSSRPVPRAWVLACRSSARSCRPITAMSGRKLASGGAAIHFILPAGQSRSRWARPTKLR